MANSTLVVGEELGRGGMGIVHKGVWNGQVVAIKFLDARFRERGDVVTRFQRELEILRRLEHRNIVRLVHVGTEQGVYFVMEYVDGESLRTRMQRGSIEEEELVRISSEICEGLEYAHGRYVVHRDVKPENILIDGGGTVKIADFGLARTVVRGIGTPQVTLSSEQLGTPYYMAPEQMRNAHDVGPQADLYSLGVVLYEVVTGRMPVGATEAPRAVKPGIHSELSALVMQLLQPDPARRPASALEVRQRLGSLRDARLAPEVVPTEPVSYPTRVVVVGDPGVRSETPPLEVPASYFEGAQIIPPAGIVPNGLGPVGRVPGPRPATQDPPRSPGVHIREV